MHSNLASFKKPKIQFSQCQDAQTPNKPFSKQPKFIMPTRVPTFKTKLFGYKAIIFYTSRDTTKLAFLTLAVLKVGTMNFGCFETGCFGFGCAGAGQIVFFLGFFGFHYWRF
jgi:hypothetical protein